MSSNTTISPPQTPQVILSPETLKATGLLNLTNEQVKRALFVRNISSKASLKQVSDFFNFCGNVEKIIQDQDPTNEGKQFAVVIFEQESAYSTALLLGQAVIVDSPITVFPYSKILSVTAPAAATTKTLLEPGAAAGGASSSATTTGTGNSSNDRQSAAVIASLIAQGYVRGELLMNEMKQQAKQLDQQVGVSNRVKMAAEISRKKAQDIDNSLHLTQRLNSLKSEAQMGVRIVGQELGKVRNDLQKTFADIEEKYKIQEKAKQASQATIKTAQDLYNKTMENDAIRNTTSAVSNLLSTGWNSLRSSFTNIQQETQQEIRKQKEKTGTASSSSSSLQQQQRPTSSQQQPISYASLDDDNNVEEDLIEDYEEQQPAAPAPQQQHQQAQDFMAFEESAPQQQQQPPKAPQQEDLFKFD